MQPETVHLGDGVAADEQMVKQVVFEDKLDSLVVLVGKLVPPPLELASKRALRSE